MATIIKENSVRKTFNISDENAEKMAKLLSQRKQTEFVNLAIKREFEYMQKELALEELKTKIHVIKRVKSNTSIGDTLDEVRAESLTY